MTRISFYIEDSRELFAFTIHKLLQKRKQSNARINRAGINGNGIQVDDERQADSAPVE